MKIIKIAIICLIFHSCCNNSVPSHVEEICDSKEIIIREFSNTMIYANRSSESIQIEYYYDKEISQFFFERSDSALTLFRKELNFPIENFSFFFNKDSICNSTDTATIISLVKNDVKRKLELMDSLDIISVSAQEMSMGIDLMIYIEEGIINYISNIDSVQNPIWKNHVDSLIRVEDDMYFEKYCRWR